MRLLLNEDTVLEGVGDLKDWISETLVLSGSLYDKHNIQNDERAILINGSTGEYFRMNSLPSREEGRKKIIDAVKDGYARGGTVHLVSFKGFIERQEGDDTGNLALYRAFNEARKTVGHVCADQKTIAVMVPHYHQEGMMPHVHFLYDSPSPGHSILQTILVNSGQRYSLGKEGKEAGR